MGFFPVFMAPCDAVVRLVLSTSSVIELFPKNLAKYLIYPIVSVVQVPRPWYQVPGPDVRPDRPALQPCRALSSRGEQSSMRIQQ